MRKEKTSTFYPPLSEAELEAIERFQTELDKKFGEIAYGNFSAKEICDMLYPYVSTPYIASKISNLSPTAKDKRHVNLRIAAAMRRVFGVSLDEILDECFQSLPPRTPPKKI